ncbi:MAG: hypothetical protein AMXMBFR64_22130 [Myxococcales bacterium]
MLDARRLVLVIALLIGAWIWSTELFAIAAGVVVTWLIVRWKTAPKEEDRRPVEPETLESAARDLPVAAIRGEQVWTAIDERPVMVTLEHARSRSMGELPVIRLEVRMGPPIQYCFIVRRRMSLFPMPVLVWNTLIPRASFEYELRRVELDADLQQRFEAASNAPRLTQRLWESRLRQALDGQLDPSQLRLEELAFNGESLILVYMPAWPLEPDPRLPFVLDEAGPAVEALDAFIREEALRDATPA